MAMSTINVTQEVSPEVLKARSKELEQLLPDLQSSAQLAVEHTKVWKKTLRGYFSSSQLGTERYNSLVDEFSGDAIGEVATHFMSGNPLPQGFTPGIFVYSLVKEKVKGFISNSRQTPSNTWAMAVDVEDHRLGHSLGTYHEGETESDIEELLLSPDIEPGRFLIVDGGSYQIFRLPNGSPKELLNDKVRHAISSNSDSSTSNEISDGVAERSSETPTNGRSYVRIKSKPTPRGYTPPRERFHTTDLNYKPHSEKGKQRHALTRRQKRNIYNLHPGKVTTLRDKRKGVNKYESNGHPKVNQRYERRVNQRMEKLHQFADADGFTLSSHEMRNVAEYALRHNLSNNESHHVMLAIRTTPELRGDLYQNLYHIQIY